MTTEELQAEVKRANTSLDQQIQENVATKAAHAKEISDLKISHTKEISDLTDKHTKEIIDRTKQISDRTKEITDLKTSSVKEINDLKTSKTKEISDLGEKHKKEISDLVDKHKKEMENHKNQSAAALAKAIAEPPEVRAHREKKAKLAAEYAAAQAAVDKELQATMSK